jgi:hypothetical protein
MCWVRDALASRTDRAAHAAVVDVAASHEAAHDGSHHMLDHATGPGGAATVIPRDESHLLLTPSLTPADLSLTPADLSLTSR